MRAGGDVIKSALAGGLWTMSVAGVKLTPQEAIERALIGPNSVDLTLGEQLLTYNSDRPVDLREELPESAWAKIDISQQPYTLPPGGFVLGCVREAFDCLEALDVCGRSTHFASGIDGRSTVGRCGLAVHITAGYGDYGFDGYYTLELHNCFSVGVVLFGGMRIAQMTFHSVFRPRVYNRQYQDSQQVALPRRPLTGPGRV